MAHPHQPSIDLLPPAIFARFDQHWAAVSANLNHLIELTRAHETECHDPGWCITRDVELRIAALATDGGLQLMLLAALKQLAKTGER